MIEERKNQIEIVGRGLPSRFNMSLENNILDLILVVEEFEDTKGVIRISKSKKNRQHNA